MGKKSKEKRGEHQALTQTQEQNFSGNSGKNIFRIQAVILFAFAFILYANTIGHRYAVDDTIVIVKNDLTTKGLQGIPEIMTTDAFYGFFGEGYKLVEGGRYRPLSIVSFAIEYEFFGKNPHISHFINVVLYAITGILVFLVLLQLFQTKTPNKFELNIPFIAALLYVAHPVHTEVVANIKGRDEIMGMMGALLMLYFIMLYVKRDKPVYLLPAFVSYILALLSKENTITFLAVVPLTIYFFTKSNYKKYLITVIPLLVISAVYVYIRGEITDVAIGKSSSEILNNPFVNASLMEQWATSFFTFWEYFRLLIFPHPLTHDYYYNQVPIIGWENVKAILPFILNLAILVYAIKGVLSKNLFAYAILYYFATLSIVSNLLFTVGITMNERFIYMPSLGYCIVLALLIAKLSNYLAERKFSDVSVINTRYATIFLSIILLGYAVKTITRNQDWKDDFTLFSRDIHNSPNSAKVHNALGGELVTQTDKITDAKIKQQYLKEAERVLSRAIEIYPGYLNAWLLLGNAKYKLNDDLDEARYYYQKTLQMKPNYFEGNFNLGCVLIEKGEDRESVPYFKRAIQAKPQKHEPYYNLGEAYYKLNLPDSAIAMYKKVSELMPNLAVAYYKVGISYGRQKNELDPAIQYLSKAIELDPKKIVYFEDLGVAYGFKQDYQNAIRVLERAIQLDPNYAKAYYNLGITYRQLGDEAKAEQYFTKARELDPGMKF